MSADYLRRLLADKGITKYGLFWCAGEGEFFPDGTESMSGDVIDNTGQVYSFWTGWDHVRQRIVFEQWTTGEMTIHGNPGDEYRRARKSAGLD